VASATIVAGFIGWGRWEYGRGCRRYIGTAIVVGEAVKQGERVKDKRCQCDPTADGLNSPSVPPITPPSTLFPSND